MKTAKILYGTIMAVTISFTACKKNDEVQKPELVKGPEMTIGNGKVYSWVKQDAVGNPKAIGFTLTKGALDNLPDNHDHMGATAYSLKLPDEARNTAFTHIVVDWNAHGHEPENVYTVPHFDFHLYIMPEAERLQIPPYEQAKAKFDNLPAAPYLPANYIRPPGGVPQMGTHWIDPTSPELQGKPFTETFIVGSYNGKVTFWESMVAHSLLKEGKEIDKAIPQPSKFAVTSYYPTHYSIKKQGDDYVITFDQMQLRTQN